MSDTVFPPEDVQRKVQHMNEDHAGSVLLYAHHFAGRTDANSAVLDDVTPDKMALTLDSGETIEIAFPHRLEDGHDAHMTMVQMSQEARAALEG